MPDSEVPDIYDREDLGVLRRRIRKAGETFLRERELYLGLVYQFLEVCSPVQTLSLHCSLRASRWRSSWCRPSSISPCLAELLLPATATQHVQTLLS